MYENSVPVNKLDVENKINIICEELILMFEKLNNSRYFISIISCHAKMNDLDEALKKIIKFRCELIFAILKLTH